MLGREGTLPPPILLPSPEMIFTVPCSLLISAKLALSQMGQFGNIPSCWHTFKYIADLSPLGAKAVPRGICI